MKQKFYESDFDNFLFSLRVRVYYSVLRENEDVGASQNACGVFYDCWQIY